jgi:hypothetical protein
LNRIGTPALPALSVPTRLEQAKREFSREIEVFQTLITADAAQLCGISAIVGYAIEFA